MYSRSRTVEVFSGPPSRTVQRCMCDASVPCMILLLNRHRPRTQRRKRTNTHNKSVPRSSVPILSLHADAAVGCFRDMHPGPPVAVRQSQGRSEAEDVVRGDVARRKRWRRAPCGPLHDPWAMAAFLPAAEHGTVRLVLHGTPQTASCAQPTEMQLTLLCTTRTLWCP